MAKMISRKLEALRVFTYRYIHAISTGIKLDRLNSIVRSSRYDDVIMTMLASQITSLTVVYSIVHSGVNQRKHQSSASLAFVREIHRGPVNFPHKWPVTRKMFPFDDVIMKLKHFRCYFPFCAGICWSPVGSPHEGTAMRTSVIKFLLFWTNREQTVEQALDWPVIRDAMAVILTPR